MRFALQRFENAEGQHCSWFDFQQEFQQGYVSERLAEYGLLLSLENSYEKVEQLLNRQTHDEVISSGQLQRMAVEKAEQISRVQAEWVQQAEAMPLPSIATSVDLYDPKSAELLVFEDGIQVKGQKNQRKSKYREAPGTDGKGKRPTTDMAIMPDGKHLIGGIGIAAVVLWQVMRAHVKRRYADQQALPLVAITDGAKNIRDHFELAFQVAISWILDWFHLKKKVNELCILICLSKAERQQNVKIILRHCWVGEVDKALDFLRTDVKSRNQKVLEELQNYLTKHKPEIINYQKRQKAGKVIGSGCMESAVNQTVARRQKTRGMSWSAVGSKALAILSTHRMNHEWDSLWAFNKPLIAR